MNLHLCSDGNFIQQAIDVFEHFYPQKNIFIIFNFREARIYTGTSIVYRCDRKDVDIHGKILNICREYYVNNVITHGILYCYSSILKNLKLNNAYRGKVYWIFWGYELYNALGEQGKYKLVDSSSITNKISYMAPTPMNAFLKKILGRHVFSDVLQNTIPYWDYFCFWFPYDFDLLNKFYNTNIKYKFFKYISDYKSQLMDSDIILKKKYINRIVVNHQASLTGNHKTILKKLKLIEGIDKFQICTPLSYGSNYIKSIVLKIGKRYFGEKFFPILEMMPIQEYNEFLDSTSVAIFGTLRQEAAGNIMRLLKSGAKVYLRDSNPLLQYYKEKGFIIFSFERDLNSVYGLNPLQDDEQLHNMNIAKETQIYYEDFMPYLFN